MSLDELDEFADEVEEDDDVITSSTLYMEGVTCIECEFESVGVLEEWRVDNDLSAFDVYHGDETNKDDNVLLVCVEE